MIGGRAADLGLWMNQVLYLPSLHVIAAGTSESERSGQVHLITYNRLFNAKGAN